MKKCFPVLFLILLFAFTSLPAAAYNYEFHHVAVRDYNGDGLYNGRDHVRYGFKVTDNDGSWPDITGWQAQAHINSDESMITNVGGGTPYFGAFNSQTYSQENYWAAKFNSTQLFSSVDLVDSNGNTMESHIVNLPDLSQPFNAYNGFDVGSVSWQRQSGGWLFAWDGIAIPSSEASSYRFTLNNWENLGYEILFSIEEDQTELFLSDDLLGVADSWVLQFQQRFTNPNNSVENYNWIRSYGAARDIILNNGTLHTPIPGAVWLLGSGLVGLIGFKKRFKK